MNDIVLLLSLAWGLSEIGMSIVRRSSPSEASQQDRRSLPLLLITIWGSMFAAISLTHLSTGQIKVDGRVLEMVGLIILVAGVALRWTAILTLKKSFTVDVAVRQDQVIIRHGVYRLLRHPSYSGVLLCFAGVGIALASWLSLGVLLVPIFLALLYRINVEEAALRGHFGAAYEGYMRHTKRLIPFIY